MHGSINQLAKFLCLNMFLYFNCRNTEPKEPQFIESDDEKEDPKEDVPKLKDKTNLELRRAESMRRQQYYRAKYNIPDRRSMPQAGKSDSHGLRDSVRAKWGLKRSKTYTPGSRQKDPRNLTKEEEQFEREKSKQNREAIRARYNLNT